MRKALKRITACVLALMLAVLSLIPSAVITNAAPPLEIKNVRIAYDSVQRKYNISYPGTLRPEMIEVSRYDETGAPVPAVEVYESSVSAGQVSFSLAMDLQSDFIYHITIRAFQLEDDVDPYAQGSFYYLSDITFEGESFNVMAAENGEDLAPEYLPAPGATAGTAEIVRSGLKPRMRLKWKVPRVCIYNPVTGITPPRPITELDGNDLKLLTGSSDTVDFPGFQISMNKGKGSSDIIYFNTEIYGANQMRLSGSGTAVSAIDASGCVSVDLNHQSHGIQPGTEYEYTNIGLFFQTTSGTEVRQIFPDNTSYFRAASDNQFMVFNMDDDFFSQSTLYTPMSFEITKVDEDKVEVRFWRLVNGSYPTLYYQVQHAINPVFNTLTNTWVKIPDGSIPAADDQVSEVVTINIPGSTHPDYYFRVVYYDSTSGDPKSYSLLINLRSLGVQLPKPPLPREILVEPLYMGIKQNVPVTSPVNDSVDIPMSNLELSFEKPLSWRSETFPAYVKGSSALERPGAYVNGDYTFHVLLSAYLPGSSVNPQEMRTIGVRGTQADVFVPVKQQRSYVFGKYNLYQDPANPNRLICVIPGDQLFIDSTSDTAINSENFSDPDMNGESGDYPSFLVPNTTYYMQIFTSRYGDNAAINLDVWGDGLDTELQQKISYLSPVASFTTWPLNQTPIPMPNLDLRVSPRDYVDPVTGDMTLEGIYAEFPRILTEVDWERYTTLSSGRYITYEIDISRTANDPASFVRAKDITAVYPDDAEVTSFNTIITRMGLDPAAEAIKPNTVYYLRARATLYLGDAADGPGDDELLGSSVYSPVKAITTPKIHSGGLDNVTRDPRSPSEFAVATNSEGEPQLTDARVDLAWLHAERDVTYEMVCTSRSINQEPNAGNIYRVDTVNLDFLQAYNAFRNPADDSKIHINLNDAAQRTALHINLNNDTGRTVFSVDRDFLKPNQIYFFSLRAVRNRGLASERASQWVTIPVTTRMVKAPGYLEAVRDLQVGFNVQCSIPGSTADAMEVYLKKKGTADTEYVKLVRSQYSVVKDNTTYYIRIYNLEPNLWYDIRLFNKTGNSWYSYPAGSWGALPVTPIPVKTRDTLHEIEVRWEGEGDLDALYTYQLEARSEFDVDYETLAYSPSGFTDYGYDRADGTRVKYYREKTSLHVEEGSNKYVYYAKIQGKPVKNADGTKTDRPLLTNTLYAIKVWATNEADSLHVGPVTVRTDFSQKDYDDQKQQEAVAEIYNMEAEKLTRKLYWVLDKGKSYATRALIKGDMVAGLMQGGPGTTVTVDLTGEQEDPSLIEVLIPQKILEAIESYDARLNLKVKGAEFTLNRGSVELAALKQQALTGGAKEAMLKISIERKASPSAAFPAGYKSLTRIYAVNAQAVGSRYTYAELNTMIYKILKDSKALGPFRYGLFDRELTKVLQQAESYSYRSQTELKDMIQTVVSSVELELSRYLKDIIDGGSGYPSAALISKAVASFPNRMGIKLEYPYQNGLITPYVNYGAGWREASGSKAYAMQYALFRIEKAGEFAVVVSGSVSMAPGTPYSGVIEKLGSRYDLSKVFGKATILPSNPVTGQQAVMLYAVICERDEELTGLTPAQKVEALNVGDVVAARQLTGYMDNQTSLSLAVKLYGEKSGVPVNLLKPSKTIYLTNPGTINKRLYHYVLLGLDLGFAKANNRAFDATGRSTTGQFLDMVSKALEKTGD